MDVAQWQKRLQENFTVRGVIGGDLGEVIKLEDASRRYVAETFHGQLVLLDSFQSFYAETLRITLRRVADHGWPMGCESYPAVFLYYVLMFRTLRACENLFLAGYALDGYALLRTLKERAFFMAGIAHNMTTLGCLFGYKWAKAPGQAHSQDKKQGESAQRRVLGRIIGRESGLAPHTGQELRKWKQFFDEEVHGSKLSFCVELGDWVHGKAPPSIGPTVKEMPLAMYMNRVTEIAWLLLRLLPFLQPTKDAFGPEWHRKQEILDDSFRFAQLELSTLGKSIGKAFIDFVDGRFSFGDPFHYFEATGSG